MRKFLKEDAENFRRGLVALYDLKGFSGIECNVDEAVERAMLVKAARESDPYACLGLKGRPSYDIEGLSSLREAVNTGRPVILLSGHIGSFYTVAVALDQEGFAVDQVARSVAKENPWPRRYYEHTNYILTQKAFRGQYIFSNFAGKVDRRILQTCKNSGILYVCNDLPRTLFPSGRRPVTFLGQQTTMTARTVELGIKYNALFLVAWNEIELNEHYKFTRKLRIEPRILDSQDVDDVLQCYADSLSKLVFNTPWQWAATQVVTSFGEEGRLS